MIIKKIKSKKIKCKKKLFSFNKLQNWLLKICIINDIPSVPKLIKNYAYDLFYYPGKLNSLYSEVHIYSLDDFPVIYQNSK